jgi:S-adenosylmethionine synthetase
MSRGSYLFTSESVSEGHPDKVADRISDEILDGLLARDPRARVAVETLVTTNYCLIAGEVTGPAVDYAALARKAIREIGYGSPGFDPATLEVNVRVHAQSREIATAVEADTNLGAGDQGIMFGFACNETPTLMPAPIHYAHRIVEHLAERRHAGLRQLGPDAKSQVTVEYRNGRPARAHTVVVSHMHAEGLLQAALAEIVRESLNAVLPTGWLDANTRILVNPSGSFIYGGPAADTGLTGRKIIVDTYGGAAPHGGGAFSGKDPTKVDRSAAYAARHLAKNVVAAGLAERCLIQLAYAIGVAEPLALYVDTQGTGRADDARIEAAIRATASLTPRAIRDRLGLDRPIYARTAAYGHFGRAPDADGGFSWEKTDLGLALRAALG